MKGQASCSRVRIGFDAQRASGVQVELRECPPERCPGSTRQPGAGSKETVRREVEEGS